MGSAFDSEVIKDEDLAMGYEDVKAAFEEISIQRASDHGNDGYTGTFAEKESIKIYVDIFDDVVVAEKWVNELDAGKWDEAICVGVKGVGWFIGGWCSA